MRLARIVSSAAFAVLILGATAGRAASDPEKPAAKPAPPAAEKPAAEKPAAEKPAAEKPEPKTTETPESKAEKLFDEGRDAMFRGSYDEAIKLLAAAVAADKTKTSHRLHLARAYRYADKQKEAAGQLEEILKLDPDHVEAGQSLAEIYTRQKQWKDVVRVLEPLLTYRHDYPTYHMLAEAQVNLDQNEKARKNFEEAIKLNPKSASDHYQLGNIYLAGNFFALAAESYKAALRLGMESPVLHYKLGSAHFNLRNYFGKVTLRTVRSGKPGSISEGWYLIERVPGRKDAFHCAPENSAIYQVARALEDGIQERADIHVLRASIYLNARRYQPAYEMFAEIGPTVPEADKPLFYFYQAEAAFGTGRYEEYLELLGKAIELDPEGYEATLVDAYQRVADQYNEAGELAKYIEFLAKAVAESPRTASLHLKLASAYEEAQQPAKAVVQWQMVLDLEPDHPQRTTLLNLIEKARTGMPLAVGPTRPADDVVPTEEPKAEPQEPKAEDPAEPKAEEPAAEQ